MIEIEKLLQSALEAAGKVDRPANKCTDYVSVAGGYLDNGQKERCQEVLKLAAAQADKVKLPEEKAVCLAYLAGLLKAAGDNSGSKDCFTRAVLLARAAETPSEQAKALNEIGWELAASDLPQETAGVLERLYGLVQDPQNGLDTAFELIGIAELYIETGNPGSGAKILDQALSASLEIKDNWFKVERLIGIAEAGLDLKDSSGTAKILERVKPFLLDVAVIDRAAFWLRIGDIYTSTGDTVQASEALKSALDSVEINTEGSYKVENLVEIAGAYLALNENHSAIDLLERAQQKNTEVEDLSDKIAGLIKISLVLVRSGERDQAEKTAGQALELCREFPNKKETLFWLGNLAVTLAGLGDKGKTAEIVDSIITIAAETRSKTSGLGTIAVEIAGAGATEEAARLVDIIHDPHIKAQSLTGIAQEMVKKDENREHH
jgi:tetratricopeptide (TPR) repeat protein